MEDYLHQKCSNLLNYLMEYISQLNLKLKITVNLSLIMKMNQMVQ